MIEHNDYRILYIVMSAIAGSVTALSFMKYKEMSWREIALTLFVGFAFAVIFVPWVAADWLKVDVTNLRTICAVVYLGGTAWNGLMPVVIKRFKNALGGTEESA